VSRVFEKNKIANVDLAKLSDCIIASIFYIIILKYGK